MVRLRVGILVVIGACGPTVGQPSAEGDGGGSSHEEPPPQLYIYCDDDPDCHDGLDCFAAGTAWDSISWTMCSVECLAPSDCPEPPAGWEATCIHPYGADAPDNEGDGGGPVDPEDGGWHCALACTDDDTCPAGMECYEFGTFVGDICRPPQR